MFLCEIWTPKTEAVKSFCLNNVMCSLTISYTMEQMFHGLFVYYPCRDHCP